MLASIKNFYNQLQEDQDGHRYKSWEHCFNAFGNHNQNIDILSLHLAFYLASWGMYRGSSGLLWKDYTIHRKAVEIILRYSNIRVTEMTPTPDPQQIFNCFSDLKKYYSQVEYNNTKIKKSISATDTLLTKIMLGTLGNIPAFDRYFLIGVNGIIKPLSVKLSSIEGISQYAIKKSTEISSCQEYIYNISNQYYPPMKIIDMYFWEIGFDKESSK